MTRSMTGRGSGAASASGCEVRVELTSVNGRGLNVKARLPDALAPYQAALEARVRETLERGTLTVAAEFRRAGSRARIHRARLAEYVRELGAAGKNLPPPSWEALLSLPGVLESPRDEAPLEKLLEKALAQALKNLEKDRAREGKALERICSSLLDQAEAAAAKAEARRVPAQEAYRGRLSERLKAALARENLKLEEPELRRELLLYSERADVEEELSRLKVHVAEARRCFSASGPVGRRLDFLSQEMLREANTLASKSADATLSLAAVDLKTALDRLKEQVQNLE